jgi:hypothetical protein
VAPALPMSTEMREPPVADTVDKRSHWRSNTPEHKPRDVRRVK